MTEHPEPTHQAVDFRTQFFPAPCPAATTAPDCTRLVEHLPADVVGSMAAAPFLVQCNCACK